LDSGAGLVRIAVIGLWHLGTVTAACLASAGYSVIGFDDNTEIVKGLTHGRLPVFEPHLEALIRKGVEDRKLEFTANLGDVEGASIVWITYDTPVDESDRADVEYVVNRVKGLYPCVSGGAMILISSQLPVGSTRKLEELYRRLLPDGNATFAYSPENLRLGKAIEAFTRPERVVVGVRAAGDRDRIARMLQPFTENIEWMSVESAEMTKHALNAFLATSVAFTNELAGLCERVGADAKEIERGLKSDPRIGPRAYLSPGGAFSGGTLARDLSFLVEMGRAESLPVHLLSSIRLSNESHKTWPRRRLLEVLGGLQGKTVAVLGLTYKPGTDTLRRSVAVETCRWLSQQGATATAYDPAVRALPDEFTNLIDLRPSIEQALRGAAAAIVATEWPEFTSIEADSLISWMERPLVLDPGRFLESRLGKDERIQYLSVGCVQ
jgi:UDPglucose 6-dehydrogenase